MRRFIISFASLCLSLAASAQSGVLYTRPAAEGDGKYLNQAEANISSKTRPQNFLTTWIDAGHYMYMRPDRKLMKVSALTGEESEYEYPADEIRKSLPSDAENVIKVGDKYVFTRRGSIYYKADKEKTRTISESTEDGILFGETVSKNEFGISGGLFPAPDGSKLAFYRKDERSVTRFPLLDISTRTGSLKSVRYPMNGMASERISLGIYDLAKGNVVWAAVNDFDNERYLTNVSWSADSRFIYIQVLDRAQHHMHLNKYSAADGSFIKTVLSEENDAWIEPLDPVYPFGDKGQFIYRTDGRDAYRSLYLCDDSGTARNITPVAADVRYLGNDGKYVYYTSAEVSPVENHLFRVAVTNRKSGETAKAKIGKPERLTHERGWHDISLSEDCSFFIDSYSSIDVPREILLKSTDGKISRQLHSAENPLKGYVQCELVFGTVKSADGQFDNYYRLFKPRNFDPAKKYPLVVYVYGGPHSQIVKDSWLGGVRLWEMYMAERGYVVYVQDNRGTQNRGAAFEKAINRQCGQAEMADQMEGVKMLMKEPWIDPERIGVHGWSYGGFMTISLMTNYPEVFKAGVAGGPVIDWKWYEVMYGERYMDTEAANPEGFAKTSLINKAGDLKGKLLICQGAMDSTVLWEHSLSFVQKCIEENVQLDYFPYPRSEHNVFGQWRVHLMDKVTDYFNENL